MLSPSSSLLRLAKTVTHPAIAEHLVLINMSLGRLYCVRETGVVCSNSTMFSVSDKYDSVNECTQEISKSVKLHILGVWQMAMKFIRQLANPR